MKLIIKIIIFLLGLAICVYPIISGAVERKKQSSVVSTYEYTVEHMKDSEKVVLLEKAKKYNDMLYQSQGYYINDEVSDVLSEKNYKDILWVDETGIMGAVEIPKINVYLPIYHGTDDEVLSTGTGHLYGTSLPIGGINTHSVITGHRGLPNSKLFTRLDEMNLGDLFYVHVLKDILAYKVVSVDVIRPEEIEKLEVVPEKDFVTLLTCTPYGINTHRLLIRGERVDYELMTYDSLERTPPSLRELVFVAIPIGFAGYGVLKFIKLLNKKEGDKN